MTTVGYGDAFPITTIGKCIAGVAMLAGIFCVALPTGILGTEFSKLFQERENGGKKARITLELRSRPKAELELFLECEKLEKAKKELEEQLMYVKRLAYTYVEASNKENKANDSLKIDPMYTAFQNKAVVAMDSMMRFVVTVSDGLAQKHYATALGGTTSSRRMSAD